MYVVLVYDIDVTRIDKVRNLLKRYLFWIQNSVFEGEISDSSFKAMTQEVKALIDTNYDSIVIYIMKSQASAKRQIIGLDLSLRDFIV
ncbi:MAG: CRISPR-associated endonuclease Cas2 [Candidatus Thorarchaeota archaeon]|nr:CRISPR-associated endonuclease Cas2 [Candidatus Thorarchaeota archaeon]